MLQSRGLVATAIRADPKYGMVRRLITLTTLTAALAVPAAAQATAAVKGSMTVRTSVILVAGKPLNCACSFTAASFSAR